MYFILKREALPCRDLFRTAEAGLFRESISQKRSAIVHHLSKESAEAVVDRSATSTRSKGRRQGYFA